jgi:flagellar motor component MotA
MKMVKNLDTGSLIVILVTFVLFALALFTKGFTHDLLLETGVFLVSVKLIIMAYRTNVNNQVIAKELSEIKATLRGKEKADEQENIAGSR